jgi:hypothetical protein
LQNVIIKNHLENKACVRRRILKGNLQGQIVTTRNGSIESREVISVLFELYVRLGLHWTNSNEEQICQTAFGCDLNAEYNECTSCSFEDLWPERRA